MGGILNYALLFYSIATTLSWLPVLFSPKHRSRLCQELDHQQEKHRFLAQNPLSHAQDFPLKIWQTAKTSVAGQDPGTQSSIQSWIEQNPNHRYEMVTDGGIEIYVAKTFAHKPEIIHDFLALQDPVLRADLVRYLILYGDGGVYTDLDTVCLRPFESWIPVGLKDKTNMVVGLAGDSLGGPLLPGFSHLVDIGQSTVAAKPGHLIMRRVIEEVLSRLKALAEKQNRTLGTVEASYQDVIDTTGPGVFSECIYRELSHVIGTELIPTNLSGLTEPRLIGDVLILPVTGFTPGVPHSNAGGPEDKNAMVQHLFAGSWKADHPFATEDTSLRI